MSARSSIWRDVPESERRVVNADARASTQQVRFLNSLGESLGWQVAWPIYEALIGERIDLRPPRERYRNLTREQVSTLIEAYKNPNRGPKR